VTGNLAVITHTWISTPSRLLVHKRIDCTRFRAVILAVILFSQFYHDFSFRDISACTQANGTGLLDLYMSMPAASNMYIHFIADVMTDWTVQKSWYFFHLIIAQLRALSLASLSAHGLFHALVRMTKPRAS